MAVELAVEGTAEAAAALPSVLFTAAEPSAAGVVYAAPIPGAACCIDAGAACAVAALLAAVLTV